MASEAPSMQAESSISEGTFSKNVGHRQGQHGIDDVTWIATSRERRMVMSPSASP